MTIQLVEVRCWKRSSLEDLADPACYRGRPLPKRTRPRRSVYIGSNSSLAETEGTVDRVDKAGTVGRAEKAEKAD